MWSSNCIGIQSWRNPYPSRLSRALMPGASGSPTGRTPHDRSRTPFQTSGVTSKIRPAAVSVPSQTPTCA